MFPKFLRVVTARNVEYFAIINETTKFWKKILFRKDEAQLEVVAQALGFSYEVLFAPDGEGFGERLANGSWTKALGMIQRREADLVFGYLSMTEEIHEDFHLSYPFAVEEVTFITKKHEPVSNTAVFLHPFSITVWLSIIACLCLMPIAFHCLLRRTYSAVNLFASTLRPLAGQGIEISPQKHREYLVLGSWILTSSLFYYFYAAVLLSFLTFPTMLGISTIEDLANGIKDGKYQCTTYENSIYSDVFSNQRNTSLEVVGNHLTESWGFDYFLNFLTATYDKKRCFVGLRSEFLPYKEFFFVSEETFQSSFVAFVTHQDFCCGSRLDKFVHHAWASGLFQKISDHFSNEDFIIDFVFIEDILETPPSEVQLTMTVLKGPFIFLIASHSLALLVFVIEVCMEKYKSH